MGEPFVFRVAQLMSRTEFPGLTFAAKKEGDHVSLRVVAFRGSPFALDNTSGASMPWNGRWWRLSEHMTDGEIVRTALKAVLAALEHEAREKFTFDGVAVYGPHIDVHALVALGRSPGAGIVERAAQ